MLRKGVSLTDETEVTMSSRCLNMLAGWGLFLVLTPGFLTGQTPNVFLGSGFSEEDGIVTTRHEITLDGRTLGYTARAGLIPIRDNATGEAHAHMYFISYSLEDNPNNPPRPLTFLWNGGPGSSSSLVHLLGFGPKRINSEGELQPNQGTWLEMSNLVFVDPIGTGYSRPLKKDYTAEFYQNRGDAESVAEFIRVYLTRADAWDAPLFLAGESFGVERATRVADILQRKRIPVTGMMLIGLVPRLAPIAEEIEAALALPTYTASAFHHERLDNELQRDFDAALHEAETWSLEQYAPAIAHHKSLGDKDLSNLLAGLSRLSGVDKKILDGGAVDSTLTLGLGAFAQTLLYEQGRVLGHYDSRMTGIRDTTQIMYDPTTDPSLQNMFDEVPVIRYMRDELGYESDLRYQGPFGGSYPPPKSFRGDWMSMRWDWSGPSLGSGPPQVDDQTSDPTPAVERIMRADENLHVYTSCGYYDLVCSYAVIGHMEDLLDPSLSSRVTVRTYHGGHATYLDDKVRLQMRADVTSFIREAVHKQLP